MSNEFYALNSVRLCIDDTINGIKGRAYTPLCDRPLTFNDFGRLIIDLDQIFDKNGYPQAFTDTRSFDSRPEYYNRYKGQPSAKLAAGEILSETGAIATFDMVINSRRSSSWQGILFDELRNRVGNFTGEVELLATIDKYILEM